MTRRRLDLSDREGSRLIDYAAFGLRANPEPGIREHGVSDRERLRRRRPIRRLRAWLGQRPRSPHRLVDDAVRAVAGVARARIRADHPWLTEYPNLLSEAWVAENLEHHRELVQLVEELAARAAGARTPRLLEAGAGSAAFSLALSRRNYDVTAVDSDPLMVLRAQHISSHLGGYARIQCLDLRQLDAIADGWFDVVFSQGTLEHFDNPAIRDLLAAQLRIGRYVVFSVPSVFWPTRDFVNERKMSLDEWKALLQSVDAELLHLAYYQRGDLHVLAALAGSSRSGR
jgi:SAM-dependent methyltransferase